MRTSILQTTRIKPVYDNFICPLSTATIHHPSTLHGQSIHPLRARFIRTALIGRRFLSIPAYHTIRICTSMSILIKPRRSDAHAHTGTPERAVSTVAVDAIGWAFVHRVKPESVEVRVRPDESRSSFVPFQLPLPSTPPSSFLKLDRSRSAHSQLTEPHRNAQQESTKSNPNNQPTQRPRSEKARRNTREPRPSRSRPSRSARTKQAYVRVSPVRPWLQCARQGEGPACIERCEVPGFVCAWLYVCLSD